jgi:hypothetical protein
MLSSTFAAAKIPAHSTIKAFLAVSTETVLRTYSLQQAIETPQPRSCNANNHLGHTWVYQSNIAQLSSHRTNKDSPARKAETAPSNSVQTAERAGPVSVADVTSTMVKI